MGGRKNGTGTQQPEAPPSARPAGQGSSSKAAGKRPAGQQLTRTPNNATQSKKQKDVPNVSNQATQLLVTLLSFACVSEGEWSWNDAEEAMEKQCQETRKLNEAFEAEAVKRPDPDGGDLASGQYSENFPSDEEERKCMDWFVVAGLFARVFPAFDT